MPLNRPGSPTSVLMDSGGLGTRLLMCVFNECWSSRPPMVGLYIAGAGRASSCRQLSGMGASPLPPRHQRKRLHRADAAAALLLGDGWGAEGAATDAAASSPGRGPRPHSSSAMDEVRRAPQPTWRRPENCHTFPFPLWNKQVAELKYESSQRLLRIRRRRK
jgi:hypothetical protein